MQKADKSCPHCGGALTSTKRSVPQMRRYQAMISAYFHHWPKRDDLFQPVNREDLRHWLQAKAGHRHVLGRVPMLDMPLAIVTGIADMIRASAAKAGATYIYFVPHGTDLVVIESLSIAFDKLDHSTACKIFDDVEAVAESETGMKADDVMRETESAA